MTRLCYNVRRRAEEGKPKPGRKDETMSGKGGQHNPDDVLIGFLDSPEIKALTELVSECDTKIGADNVSDYFRTSIFDRATALGIMKDGKIVPEWRDRITVRAAAIRQAKREKSEARKAARAAKHHKINAK